MHERRLVGEQQQPAGVLVEPADAGDHGVSATPALGEERVNVGAFALVVGADQAERLVDEQEQAVGVIERLAIDTNVGGNRFLRDVVGGLTADRNAPSFDPGARFATATVAEIGKELIEPAHREG